MKIKMKMKKVVIIIGLLITFSFMGNTAMAQFNAPNPPSGHNLTGNQDASSPIGGGAFILLGMGIAYGGKKFYEMKNEDRKE